jgi:Uma2 family endonuclease
MGRSIMASGAVMGMGDTVAELLDQLGGVPAKRVLFKPYPGTATEGDVIEIRDRKRRLCELVDGVLVEKAMGLEESGYAAWLVYYMIAYLNTHDLGKAYTADGLIRLVPGLIRIPDASFISWDRVPEGGFGAIGDIAPDLVVEILSKGNTKREMDRKVREYFDAGVRLVWYVDPRKRTARAFTAANRSILLREDDHLDGGDVLPGFRLKLRTWFDEAGRTGRRSPR